MSIPGIGRVLKNAGIEHTLTDGWKDRVWVRDGKPFDWDEIRSVVAHSSKERRARAYTTGTRSWANWTETWR